MKNSDFIIRLSGDAKKIEEIFDEIELESKKVGLLGEDLDIKNIPKKVKKSKLKNRSSSDIMVKLSSDEESVETFLNDVFDTVEEQLSLNSPSTHIELDSKDEDEDEQ